MMFWAPEHRPFEDFEKFNIDDVPSTSDVAMVVAQYIEEAERYRSDNVVWNWDDDAWVYLINGEASDIRTGAPSKIARK